MLAIASIIAMVPGGGSLLAGGATALGWLVKCRPCLWAIAVGALCLYVDVHAHRAERAQCDARIEADHAAAETARQHRDAAIAADLEKTYRPEVSRLAGLNASLQKKVDEYAKRKPVVVAGKNTDKAAVSCKLGAAAGLLRPSQPR